MCVEHCDDCSGILVEHCFELRVRMFMRGPQPIKTRLIDKDRVIEIGFESNRVEGSDFALVTRDDCDGKAVVDKVF